MKEHKLLDAKDLIVSYKRIKDFIHRTPIISSQRINSLTSHEILFKADFLQKIGAFKARGALNKMLYLKEKKELSDHVVAFSAGNHAQAVAWAAQILGVKATICFPQIASILKIQATKSYGADVIITKTRIEAEQKTADLVKKGAQMIHPFDDDDIILGQGTAVFEALQDIEGNIDAIFTSCGGGGLLSGSYLAKELCSPASKIFGVEPEIANDATKSYAENKIYRFDDSPKTIADGVRTLSVGFRNFQYIKNIDGFENVSEEDIKRWNQYVNHFLKVNVEPSSALAMAGANQWLKRQKSKKRILVVLSGGNIDPATQIEIWKNNYLADLDLIN